MCRRVRQPLATRRACGLRRQPMALLGIDDARFGGRVWCATLFALDFGADQLDGHGSNCGSAVLARHPYSTRARDKWAARAVARRWCGELEPSAGEPEGVSAGLP